MIDIIKQLQEANPALGTTIIVLRSDSRALSGPGELTPEARAWLAAEKGVPENLPVRDVETRSTAERLIRSAFGGAVKTVLSEWLGVDWRPPLWQLRF